MLKAVFLDRDGVLNLCPAPGGRPVPPKDAASMEIAAETSGLLARLKDAGFYLICVTNQPDVARGSRTLENVLAMNSKIRAALPLDELYVCLHDNADNCACRKPKPGMLLRGAEQFGLDLGKCWMIGDRSGDIAAGKNAGCKTVFLDLGYAEAKPDPPADLTCSSLFEAVDWILAEAD